MLGHMLLIPKRNWSTVFIFSPTVTILQLFFPLLLLLRLRPDSTMLFKGDIMNTKIRESSTTQVTTVTA
jgi:hypothetical protein